MNINEVIKYPILSEKSYQQMALGTYTFAVDFRTNKAEVKKVVEHIFEVKVERVNIMNVNKKEKKLGKFQGYTNRYKKAFVTLKEGDVINIFPEEVEEKAKTTTKKEVKADKKPDISEAEKKAAAKIAEKVKKETKEETKAVETKAVETKAVETPESKVSKNEETK